MDDEDLLRKAAMEQAEVACLATPQRGRIQDDVLPQQPRRASSALSKRAAAPRIGSSAAASADPASWQAQRIRAQDRLIGELRARLK
eukprot:2708764-Alexandrium_andersonii.AAC.1